MIRICCHLEANLFLCHWGWPQEKFVEDDDPSSYIALTPGKATNSDLCYFDDQFRLVFTPDMECFTSSNSFYKLSDTNPGQYFYNVFYVNDTNAMTITLEIPYSIVSQGGSPAYICNAFAYDGFLLTLFLVAWRRELPDPTSSIIFEISREGLVSNQPFSAEKSVREKKFR